MYIDMLNKYLYNKNSFLCERNIYMKMISFIFLFFAIFLVQDIISVLYYTIILLFLILLSNISIIFYLKLLKQSVWVYCILYVIALISGINSLNSVIMILRIVFLEILIFLFVFTTEVSESIDGFKNLLEPLNKFRIPIHYMSYAIVYIMEFIPMYFIEMNQIILLMRKKDGQLKKSFTFRVYQVKLLFSTSFDKTIYQLNQLFQYMKLKFYGVEANKTTNKRNQLDCYDKLYFIIHVLILMLFAIKETII